MEYSHKYSDKSTDEMIDFYRESPEYKDVMEKLGDEVIIGADKPTEDSDAPVEHTYPTSFAYVSNNIHCFFTLLLMLY